jgi:hypothetical protein
MNRNCLPTLLIAALAFAGLLCPPRGRANTILSADVQMTGVQWAPASGTLNWSSPWELEAAASVFDSQNGFAHGYQSQIGQPATVAASAATPLVVAGSQANVDATGNILSLQSSLSETITPGVALSAFSAATAYREFTITGGTGPVPVTFSFDYSGLFQGSADAVNAGYGFDDLASLRISDGVNEWDLTASDILGDSTDQQFGGTLSQSFILDYYTPYAISLTKETEPSSVPEPGTLQDLLALVIILCAGWPVRKARRHRKEAVAPDAGSV